MPDKREAYDKLSVFIIILQEESETEDEFLTMMNTLLSEKLSPESKKKTLQETYRMKMAAYNFFGFNDKRI